MNDKPSMTPEEYLQHVGKVFRDLTQVLVNTGQVYGQALMNTMDKTAELLKNPPPISPDTGEEEPQPDVFTAAEKLRALGAYLHDAEQHADAEGFSHQACALPLPMVRAFVEGEAEVVNAWLLERDDSQTGAEPSQDALEDTGVQLGRWTFFSTIEHGVPGKESQLLYAYRIVSEDLDEERLQSTYRDTLEHAMMDALVDYGADMAFSDETDDLSDRIMRLIGYPVTL